MKAKELWKLIWLVNDKLSWHLSAILPVAAEQCRGHYSRCMKTGRQNMAADGGGQYFTLSRNASITIYNEFSPPLITDDILIRELLGAEVKQAFQIYKPFLRQFSSSFLSLFLSLSRSNEFLGSALSQGWFRRSKRSSEAIRKGEVDLSSRESRRSLVPNPPRIPFTRHTIRIG